jgi:hypothetical protein
MADGMEFLDSPASGFPCFYNRDEIRRIVEHGLLTGLWSVNDVAKHQLNPVLPSLDFLEVNPQFRDRHFRDLEAFQRRGQSNTTTTEDT